MGKIRLLIVRINTVIDLVSNAARILRGKTACQKSMATNTYANDATFHASIDNYSAATTALSTAVDKEAQLAAEWKQAQDQVVVCQNAYDKSYGIVVSQVESHCGTQADASTYGFECFQRKVVKATDPIPALTNFTGAWDPKAGLVRLHAFHDTSRDVHMEATPGPVTPTSVWEPLQGGGNKRTHTSPPKGANCYRAALQGAAGLGPWFGPISVIVPG